MTTPVLNLPRLLRKKSMSIKSKIAAIAAASIGMVLTHSSSLRAENEDSSAPEKVLKITAPIDLDEEVLYPALPDEVLERAAASGAPPPAEPAPPPAIPPIAAPTSQEVASLNQLRNCPSADRPRAVRG